MVIEMKMVTILLLLNAYLTGSNVAWKSNGVVELQKDGTIAFHSNNADFNFATAGNIQPKALLKSCFSDTDCKGEHSSCLDNGVCKCPSERIGSKCQQELFARGIQHAENPDGSKRCITHVKPKLQISKTVLRVGFRDWDSQILVSEVFAILLYEFMGIQIERYYDIASGSDGIYALGERRCDLILESWDTVRYTEPLNKYVLNKNNSVRWIRGMGYGGRNGWYVNSGAMHFKETQR